MTTDTTTVPTPEEAAAVYAEYQREQDRLAALRFVVTLHYDEHPSIDSRVVWEGNGYWNAARWAQGAAKSLICTTPHAYVEHNDEGTVYSAYRRDWKPGGGYILVGRACVEPTASIAPEQ